MRSLSQFPLHHCTFLILAYYPGSDATEWRDSPERAESAERWDVLAERRIDLDFIRTLLQQFNNPFKNYIHIPLISGLDFVSLPGSSGADTSGATGSDWWWAPLGRTRIPRANVATSLFGKELLKLWNPTFKFLPSPSSRWPERNWPGSLRCGTSTRPLKGSLQLHYKRQ